MGREMERQGGPSSSSIQAEAPVRKSELGKIRHWWEPHPHLADALQEAHDIDDVNPLFQLSPESDSAAEPIPELQATPEVEAWLSGTLVSALRRKAREASEEDFEDTSGVNLTTEPKNQRKRKALGLPGFRPGQRVGAIARPRDINRARWAGRVVNNPLDLITCNSAIVRGSSPELKKHVF